MNKKIHIVLLSLALISFSTGQIAASDLSGTESTDGTDFALHPGKNPASKKATKINYPLSVYASSVLNPPRFPLDGITSFETVEELKQRKNEKQKKYNQGAALLSQEKVLFNKPSKK
ncbi:MAG: hypothetical protein M1549_00660 [Candidatus Dependentiae bacterium]|nr:hypothetical protein [Candidatus Dependentiae bacterium]